jgi:hypothetical protein
MKSRGVLDRHPDGIGSIYDHRRPVPGRPTKPGIKEELMHGMKRRPSSGNNSARGMMKSISSMNQGGVRHVVGGYRGGKMSKAMAASQTQTKNRYM